MTTKTKDKVRADVTIQSTYPERVDAAGDPAVEDLDVWRRMGVSAFVHRSLATIVQEFTTDFYRPPIAIHRPVSAKTRVTARRRKQ